MKRGDSVFGKSFDGRKIKCIFSHTNNGMKYGFITEEFDGIQRGTLVNIQTLSEASDLEKQYCDLRIGDVVQFNYYNYGRIVSILPDGNVNVFADGRQYTITSSNFQGKL